jgi:hypothetical protein
MVTKQTLNTQPMFKNFQPQRRFLLWAAVLIALALLATLAVISVSANPPSGADLRIQGLVNELQEDRLTARRHSAQRDLEAAGEAAVPALLGALRSDNPVLRRNAADMLGFIASPVAVDGLTYALVNDRQPSVRRNAAWALGEVSSFEPLASLKHAALMDTSQFVRQTAQDSLARMQSRLALSAGIDERELNAFAVSPQNPDIIYAASGRDVVYSYDSAKSWTVLVAALPSVTNSLAVSPADSNVLYAGVDSLGMFKSTDGGRTWNSINRGLPVTPGARLVVSAITIDPATPERIVIATGVMLGTGNVDFYPTGIYSSEDGGLTWSQVRAESQPLTQIEIKGDRLYGLAGDRVVIYSLG